MHTQTHALKQAQPTLLSGEVMRFDAITPHMSEHRLVPFTIYGCVFVFVFVRQESGQYCFCTLLEVLLTVDLLLTSWGLLLSSKPQTP